MCKKVVLILASTLWLLGCASTNTSNIDIHEDYVKIDQKINAIDERTSKIERSIDMLKECISSYNSNVVAAYKIESTMISDIVKVLNNMDQKMVISKAFLRKVKKERILKIKEAKAKAKKEKAEKEKAEKEKKEKEKNDGKAKDL